MTLKKVSFGVKPSNNADPSLNAEDWVKNREENNNETMKRLTLDVPESLHRRIKVSCATRGTKMAEELRSLLETHYTQT